MLNALDVRVESFKSAYNSTLKLIDCLKAIKKRYNRAALMGIASVFFNDHNNPLTY